MNKLAIIIPYYKISFFEETIESISKQTDKRFTLYIGNDASKDDPLPIIEKHLKEIDYKYFFYKTNLGKTDLPGQWQRILNNVKEEWFQILGDDDYISDNFVELFYSHLPLFENRTNLIKVNVRRVNEFSETINKNSTSFKTGFYDIFDFLLLKFYGETTSSLSEHIFLKPVFDKIGFKKYPLAWHTDDMLVLQICHLSTYYYINECSVRVRLSSSSISGSDEFFEQKAKASYLFFKDFLLLLKGNKNHTFKNKNKVFQIIRRFHPYYGIHKANKLIYHDSFQGKLYILGAKLFSLFYLFFPKARK